MDQLDVNADSASTTVKEDDDVQCPASTATRPATITAAADAAPTPGTASDPGAPAVAPPAWIYALGRIEPRFPKISTEKEFAQALGGNEVAGLTNHQALQAALSRPENRYLVRQLCWVMTIEGLETYIVAPRDPVDFSLLIEALRPVPQPWDLDCVIGVRGPIAQPEVCNGLTVPILVFDQLYSFDRNSLIQAIPKPKGISAKDFAPAAEELFDRIMLMTDNAGATDHHRALNYLAVRYPRMYEVVFDAFGRNEALSAVEVRLSPLSGTRRLVDVVLAFTNRTTDVVSKQAARVDVTDEFPFLVNKMSQYYDR